MTQPQPKQGIATPPSLKAFRIFKLENNRLSKLYDNSIYSFKIARDSIYEDIHAGRIGHNDSRDFLSFESNSFTIGHIQSAAHNFRLRHPRYLRELIYIRLISALEVFLIDAVKEAFMEKKQILTPPADSFLQIATREFLSYKNWEQAMEKYIARETRAIQSQGFDAIRKFYARQLGIDFAKSGSNLEAIGRYHEERHLLVHSLGKTDEYYRHKYSTSITELSIDEAGLLKARQEIFGLVLHVNNALATRIQ